MIWRRIQTGHSIGGLIDHGKSSLGLDVGSKLKINIRKSAEQLILCIY